MSHKTPEQRRQRREAQQIRLNPDSKWDTPKEWVVTKPKLQRMTPFRIAVVVGGIAIAILGLLAALGVI